MRLRYHAFALGLLIVAGCGGNDTTAPPPPTTESHTWIGSFTEGGVRGALSLEASVTDGNVTGQIVITRVPTLNVAEHMYVYGTMDDSLHLALDTNRVAYQFTFNIDAALDSSNNLSGTITYPLAGLFTSFTAHTIAERDVSTILSYDIPTYVRSMVWDGARLWVSTLNDEFLRFNDHGVFQDQIIVYYAPGIRWTSGALTFDGRYLLGFLPTTIQNPGGTVNGSSLYKFDETGIKSRYEISHRTWGLAYDGEDYWSLDLEQRQLVQLDTSAVVLDSLAIDVPDPYHLEYEGGHFWTMSYYTARMYQVDANGQATAVYVVPHTLSGQIETSIAVQNNDIWYSEEVGFERTRIYKLEPK
jgi:hypothetical protein